MIFLWFPDRKSVLLDANWNHAKLDNEEEENSELRQSGRTRVPPQHLKDYYFLQQMDNSKKNEEYSHDLAQIIAMVMAQLHHKTEVMTATEKYAFIQTYSLKKGLKHFENKGRKAVEK